MISGSCSVSVIIPVLNRADLVVKAIRSVLGQNITPESLEVLVVDDGSTDDSLAAALACGPLVRGFRHETPQGQSAARNHALREARGEFIYFLDSDDLCPPGALEALRETLAADPATVLVYGGSLHFRTEAELPALLNGIGDAPVSPVVCPGTMMVRRGLFGAGAVGLFDESLRAGETIDWFARAQAAGIVPRELPRFTLYRRVHAGNMTHHRKDFEAGYHQMIAAQLRRKRTAASPERSGDL